MKHQSFWRAAAVATCVVMLGCGRNPPAAPERSAAAAPAPQPVIAAVPPGEHSDPSLVDSAVTASLDVNAPWTDSESRTQEASPPPPDEGQQATAPGMDQDQQRASAPPGESAGAVSSPQAAVSSPQAAVDSSTQELAKSGEGSRTSTN